jgi:septum formation protein
VTVALASASPRRRELLASIGLDVRIITTSYDEQPAPGRSPIETAAVHARGKVLGASPVPWLAVGADTVVDVDGETFGKPADDAESRRMIARLAGREHAVHTAFALRAPDGRLVHEELLTTRVRFAPLDDATIDDYVASGDGRDKAGAYGIQGFGATLIERIDGDYFTVVGFPLHAFGRAIRGLGYRLVASPAGAGERVGVPA